MWLCLLKNKNKYYQTLGWFQCTQGNARPVSERIAKNNHRSWIQPVEISWVILQRRKISSVLTSKHNTGLFPSLWTFFWKHYNSFVSLWNFLNFWYVTYWRLIYNCYFIILFEILTISGQKRQICERTLKLFANFYATPMNLPVSV